MSALEAGKTCGKVLDSGVWQDLYLYWRQYICAGVRRLIRPVLEAIYLRWKQDLWRNARV